MRKGKFGIVLCFYPIAAFVAVIFHSPLIAAALAAAAIFLEKDEWAGRQTLQAWMLSALVFFADVVSSWPHNFGSAFFYSVLSFTSTALLVILVLATLVFSILGIIRVRKEGEANIPLCADLAYRAYGKVKPRPAPVQYGQPPYQPGMPMQQPMPPQGQYPPQYSQPVPQQYTPPMAGPDTVHQPQPPQPGQPNGPQA